MMNAIEAHDTIRKMIANGKITSKQWEQEQLKAMRSVLVTGNASLNAVDVIAAKAIVGKFAGR